MIHTLADRWRKRQTHTEREKTQKLRREFSHRDVQGSEHLWASGRTSEAVFVVYIHMHAT